MSSPACDHKLRIALYSSYSRDAAIFPCRPIVAASNDDDISRPGVDVRRRIVAVVVEMPASSGGVAPKGKDAAATKYESAFPGLGLKHRDIPELTPMLLPSRGTDAWDTLEISSIFPPRVARPGVALRLPFDD
jgi:hypothetical protein